MLCISYEGHQNTTNVMDDEDEEWGEVETLRLNMRLKVQSRIRLNKSYCLFLQGFGFNGRYLFAKKKPDEVRSLPNIMTR